MARVCADSRSTQQYSIHTLSMVRNMALTPARCAPSSCLTATLITSCWNEVILAYERSLWG